jgi:pimeloyl-ACP methyl ester carboxylesterase
MYVSRSTALSTLVSALALAAPPSDAARRALRAHPVHEADVRLATGVRLHYAVSGDPRAEPLVLLHGYSDSWRSFALALPGLAARHRVYALDLRGHGDSERPAGGYAMRDLAADVIAFLDAQRIPRATVVGHSMGSFVAQQVALAAPDRVRGLVLVGSVTAPRRITGIHELKAAVDAFAGADTPAPVAFAREFQESTVHSPIPAAFMDDAVAASRRLPARVWRALMDGMLATDVPAALAARRVPTLLLWGERDAMCPRAEQDALVALLPGATLIAYAETGHALHWERPARFVADVERFVGTPR